MSKESLISIPRREALKGLGCGCAGLAALVASGAHKTVFGQSGDGDLSILLAALYLENEAIGAYETAIGSGIVIPTDIATVALAFQGDHKFHRDGLIETIKSLGGTPVDAQEKYSFGPIKSLNEILKLARKLEKGAVDAYATLAANIQNRAVLNYAAHVLADEVRHVTVLNAVSV